MLFRKKKQTLLQLKEGEARQFVASAKTFNLKVNEEDAYYLIHAIEMHLIGLEDAKQEIIDDTATITTEEDLLETTAGIAFEVVKQTMLLERLKNGGK